MEAILPIIIQLISGAAGGNIAGSLLKKFTLGKLGNSLAGILGGGIGGSLLGSLLGGGAAEAASGPLANIVGDVAGGGIGGAILMIVIGVVKKMFVK